jgi:hypothetical protein
MGGARPLRSWPRAWRQRRHCRCRRGHPNRSRSSRGRGSARKFADGAGAAVVEEVKLLDVRLARHDPVQQRVDDKSVRDWSGVVGGAARIPQVRRADVSQLADNPGDDAGNEAFKAGDVNDQVSNGRVLMGRVRHGSDLAESAPRRGGGPSPGGSRVERCSNDASFEGRIRDSTACCLSLAILAKMVAHSPFGTGAAGGSRSRRPYRLCTSKCCTSPPSGSRRAPPT